MRQLCKTKGKHKMFTMAVIIVLLTLFLFVLSSKIVDPLPRLQSRQSLPQSASEINALLEVTEAQWKLKKETNKVLLDFRKHSNRSSVGFIYLHGFSASRKEVSPLAENLANRWKSPLFMTRFFGHGLGPDDLGQATKERWILDSIEALEIGKAVSDEVVLVCMSTGCALGLYLAYHYPDRIKALILLSPNYAPAHPLAFLANGPLGPVATRLLAGTYHQFDNLTPLVKAYWTTRYSTKVIPEMVSLVTSVRNLPLEELKMPILTIYTKHDKIVNVDEIIFQSKRFKSPLTRTIALNKAQQHVLAGEVHSPETTEIVENLCQEFLESLDEPKTRAL